MTTKRETVAFMDFNVVGDKMICKRTQITQQPNGTEIERKVMEVDLSTKSLGSWQTQFTKSL